MHYEKSLRGKSPSDLSPIEAEHVSMEANAIIQKLLDMHPEPQFRQKLAITLASKVLPKREVEEDNE